jgi:phosphatidylserine decarboxylase
MTIAAAIVGVLLALVTTLPLAWKWQLGTVRAASLTLTVAVALTLALALAGVFVAIHAAVAVVLIWLLTLGCASAVVLYRFYRDPERHPPQRSNVVVSPADGEVLYVRESRGGTLPVSRKHGKSYTLEELTKTRLRSGEAKVVGIGLNFLDVHVNRAPIGGSIRIQRHFRGQFGSLRRPEMVFENERATLVIDRDGFEVAVVLIASRLVRRIVTFVREGQNIALGERIGVIRFGSQVDLVLPARPDLEVLVAAGDRVVAGESIIAEFGGLKLDPDRDGAEPERLGAATGRDP